MRTIIAGSRGITDYARVEAAAHACPWEITSVISGGARGVDQLGERLAHEYGLPLDRFPADWDRYGRKAGYIRNAEMADHAEALLALWDGTSRGTRGMIEIALSLGLRVHVVKG